MFSYAAEVINTIKQEHALPSYTALIISLSYCN